MARTKKIAVAAQVEGNELQVAGPDRDTANARLEVMRVGLGAKVGGGSHIIGRVLAACGVHSRKEVVDREAALSIADALDGLDAVQASKEADTIVSQWTDPNTTRRALAGVNGWLAEGRAAKLAKAIRLLIERQHEDWSYTHRGAKGTTHSITVPTTLYRELTDLIGFKVTKARAFRAH